MAASSIHRRGFLAGLAAALGGLAIGRTGKKAATFIVKGYGLYGEPQVEVFKVGAESSWSNLVAAALRAANLEGPNWLCQNAKLEWFDRALTRAFKLYGVPLPELPESMQTRCTLCRVAIDEEFQPPSDVA